MKILGRLVGYLSVLANLAVALLAVAAGLVGSSAGAEMRLDVIPVEPILMADFLMIAGIFGLFATSLAFRPGRLSRTLMLLWSIALPLALGWAFFNPAFRFQGSEQFEEGVLIFVVSIAILIGAVLHFTLAPGRRRH